MYRLKKREIWVSEIAAFLNRGFNGQDIVVESPYSIKTPAVLRGVREGRPGQLLITDGSICCEGFESWIESPLPELDLARVIRTFFVFAPDRDIHPTAIVSDEAKVGRNVKIGPYTVIGSDVEIGDNSRILAHAIINGPARLGEWCVVKDGAIIGSEGYGFVEDEQGGLLHPPQIGPVHIGDRVWVGSNTTIERAMVAETSIGDEVKIDDLVHIGNGSRICRRCRITAGCVISYDVVLGESSIAAPNCCIRPSVKVAERTIIGQGATVIRDITEPGGVYVGVPARFLRKQD